MSTTDTKQGTATVRREAFDGGYREPCQFVTGQIVEARDGLIGVVARDPGCRAKYFVQFLHGYRCEVTKVREITTLIVVEEVSS